MTASDWDVSARALLQSQEPGHPRTSTGEGAFLFVASRCDCLHRCNKRREQAFFSVEKVDDTITMRQKRQRNLGQYEAMIYFEKEAKINKLTWLVLIFDDGKVDSYKSADGGKFVP